MASRLLALTIAIVKLNAAQRFPGHVAGNVAQTAASPNYVWMYEYPMPIPPVAEASYSFNSYGTPMDYYEIDISQFTTQIYPNLGPAYGIGFNGVSPGPTFRVKRGSESLVRFTNRGNSSATTHLHGSWSRSPWDGWADDLVPVGSFKDYYYTNTQTSRTMWYHDHADGHAAANAYYGQIGFWIIESDDDPALPSGKYDVVMAISDVTYQANGDLVSPAAQTVNWYGDTIQVNGQPWPYFSVEPRKYRLRILDASLSRPYELFINNSQQQVEMIVVASDGGFFQTPVSTKSLQIANGERYEVVVDFAPYAGTNLTMGNSLSAPDVQEYDKTDKVMLFAVGSEVSDPSNNDAPGPVDAELPPQPSSRDVVDHVFNFQRINDTWNINGVTFDDPAARVLARPPQGTVENWQLRYASGPGVHPVHVHLVDFKVVSRAGGSGRGVLPYEAAGMKDVVLLSPGEVVNVVAWYGPWNGQYMFHCHNLVHEDDEMMDAFNATFLEELGYADWVDFDDPMDTRFAPTASAASYYEAEYITATLMPSFASLNAYRNQSSITRLAAEVYKTVGYGEASSAGAASSTAPADARYFFTTTTTTLATATAAPPAGGPEGGRRPVNTFAYGPGTARAGPYNGHATPP